MQKTPIECDHEWHTAVARGLTELGSGWYVHCERCGVFGFQKSIWYEDESFNQWEVPEDEPILLEVLKCNRLQ